MIRSLPAAGSYAPVTILIQELPGGETQVAYDTVASATVPNGDAAASQVARRPDPVTARYSWQLSGPEPQAEGHGGYSLLEAEPVRRAR